MSSRLFRILVAAIALLVAWLVADWYLSDTRQIHRRLTRIQRLVAKVPAESDLAGFAKARGISELFTEPFEARADPAGYSASDRSTLVRGIHQYRSRSSTLIMQISAERIFLDQSGGGANSFFSAQFLSSLGDLTAADQYDVRIHWQKVDGDWLIDHVLVSGVTDLP